MQAQSDLGWLPFAHLNLMRNPFGELARDDRIRATVLDVGHWVEALQSEQCALQFMGDCGRGKTTHLLALLEHFPRAAYVYLPADPPLPEVPAGTPLFIDEAQRLPWLRRRGIFRRGVPLALGTHADLRRPLRKNGYRVETVQVAATLNPQRLETIFNRRVELARLGPGAIPKVSSSDVDLLIRRFGDDVRSMESYLYDCFEELKGKSGAELRIVDQAG